MVPSYKWENRSLRLDQLIVDPELQRKYVNQRKIRRITADFDPQAIGVIYVAEREGGVYHIIDGQHRVLAMRLIGSDEEMLKKVTDKYGDVDLEHVDARVYLGLDRPEQARLFRLFNSGDQPSAIERFLVRIVEGDETAINMNQILERNGWKISNIEGFSAVNAGERVYRMDPMAFQRTIETLTRAWGHENDSTVDNRLVEGLGLVFAKYGDAVNASELVVRLQRYHGGANRMVGSARGLRDMMGRKLSDAVAELIVALYNKGRQTRTLPAWQGSRG
jgi:hypothetical protein